MQIGRLAALERNDRASLVDVGLLNGDPRGHRLAIAHELLPGDVVADGELICIEPRLPQREVRHEVVFRHLLVDVGLQQRFPILRLDGGGRRLHLQILVLELRAKIFQAGFSGAEFELGVLQLLLKLRIRQLENYFAGLQRSAGPQDDALHGAG